jgi:glycogen synthase
LDFYPLKILISTHVFSPSIGGIESCSLALAQAFSQAGHEVQIVTQTPSDNSEDNHGLKVWRQPTKRTLLHKMHWCDVFFQNHISLQTAWPLIFIRRPWIVTTATWLRKPDGTVDLWEKFKKWVLRFAANIYISKAIQEHVGHPGFVVPNPYDSETFQLAPEVKRNRSLIFLGRLVSDKGCDLLIHSMAMLRDAGLALPLTIVGTGSEEARLKQLVETFGLIDWVRFAGALKGKPLANELNRHQVLVVPSRWDEPFGIVALEGMACGCLVVGSAAGGLADTIGNCGVTFKNGDIADLARAIREILDDPELTERCREAASSHLNRHRIESVAERYLKIFEQPRANGQVNRVFSS